MKILHAIYPILFLAFVSCTGEALELQTTGIPISFSTEVGAGTRGESVSDMRNRSFGVRGYIYENDWDREEVQAQPHADWLNTKVNCTDQGECSYVMDNPKQTIKEWEYNMNYAFFAYHPYSAESHGKLTLSPETAYKAPVLHYKLHPEVIGKNNTLGNLDVMDDVMIASKIDANVANNPKVNFHFTHCMTAIQLVIENLNDQPVDLCELYMGIQIKHDMIDIPLDGTPATASSGLIYNPTVPNAWYSYISQPIKVESTRNKAHFDVSAGRHILMIPQTGTYIKFFYKNRPEDQLKPVEQERFTNKEFLPGYRYIISLQFIGENTNVLVIDADAWTDKITDIEFE